MQLKTSRERAAEARAKNSGRGATKLSQTARTPGLGMLAVAPTMAGLPSNNPNAHGLLSYSLHGVRSLVPSSGIGQKVADAVEGVVPGATTHLYSGQEPPGVAPVGARDRHPRGYAGDFYFTAPTGQTITDPVALQDIAMSMAAKHKANVGYSPVASRRAPGYYMGTPNMHLDTMPLGRFPGSAQWEAGALGWANNLNFARATGIGPTPYSNAPTPTSLYNAQGIRERPAPDPVSLAPDRRMPTGPTPTLSTPYNNPTAGQPMSVAPVASMISAPSSIASALADRYSAGAPVAGLPGLSAEMDLAMTTPTKAPSVGYTATGFTRTPATSLQATSPRSRMANQTAGLISPVEDRFASAPVAPAVASPVSPVGAYAVAADPSAKTPMRARSTIPMSWCPAARWRRSRTSSRTAWPARTSPSIQATMSGPARR